MDCLHCEERMSDYLENSLSSSDRKLVDLHIGSCNACQNLLTCMQDVIDWGKSFPAYDSPPWLAARIVARTPRIARETWTETLVSLGRWIIEPRTALAVFTAAIVFGWMGSLAGISPNLGAIARNPSVIYYQAGDLVDRAYDQTVRSFYSAPVVTEIQSGIERLREIS